MFFAVAAGVCLAEKAPPPPAATAEISLSWKYLAFERLDVLALTCSSLGFKSLGTFLV